MLYTTSHKWQAVHMHNYTFFMTRLKNFHFQIGSRDITLFINMVIPLSRVRMGGGVGGVFFFCGGRGDFILFLVCACVCVWNWSEGQRLLESVDLPLYAIS